MVLAMLSCKTNKHITKTTTATENKTAETKNIACAGMVAPGTPHIDWIKEKQKVLNGTNTQLPNDYYVYSIDSMQLVSFFMAVSNSDTDINTAIPLPDGCQLFYVSSADRRARNSVAVSVRGRDVETKLNEIGLTYTPGVGMSGHADWEGARYIINPVKNNEQHTYYILYQRPVKYFSHQVGGGSQAAPASLSPGNH